MNCPRLLVKRLSSRLSGRVVQDQRLALGVETEGTEIQVRAADDQDVVIYQDGDDLAMIARQPRLDPPGFTSAAGTRAS